MGEARGVDSVAQWYAALNGDEAAVKDRKCEEKVLRPWRVKVEGRVGGVVERGPRREVDDVGL